MHEGNRSLNMDGAAVLPLLNHLAAPDTKLTQGLAAGRLIVSGIVDKLRLKNLRRGFSQDFGLAPAVQPFRAGVPTVDVIVEVSGNHRVRNILQQACLIE